MFTGSNPTFLAVERDERGSNHAFIKKKNGVKWESFPPLLFETGMKPGNG